MQLKRGNNIVLVPEIGRNNELNDYNDHSLVPLSLEETLGGWQKFLDEVTESGGQFMSWIDLPIDTMPDADPRFFNEMPDRFQIRKAAIVYFKG